MKNQEEKKMKKMVAFLAVIVLLAMVGNYAIAENNYYELEENRNNKGQFRIAVEEEESWEKLGIKAEEKALFYRSYFSEAIQKPGVPIFVDENKKILKSKLFKELILVKKGGIVYDDSTKLIDFVDELSTEEESAFFLAVLILSSVLLMIIGNIFYYSLGMTVLSSYLSIFCLLLNFTIIFTPIINSSKMFYFVFCLVILFSAGTVFGGFDFGKRFYKFFSLCYYLAMLKVVVMLW